MKNIKTLGMSLVVASTLFVGCGGGGSSSSESTSDLTFSSNSVSAEPTLENGKKVEDATATNQISGIPGLNSVSNDSKLNTALLSSKISKRLFKHAKDINLKSYSLNETIDETENCLQGGTLSYSGSGDDTNGVSLTFTATNCNDGYENMNGSMYMTIANYDSTADEFKDYTIKFTTDFKVTNVSDNSEAKIVANSYIAINITSFNSDGEMKNYKASITIQATDGSETYGLKDCEYYFKDDTNLEMYQTKGRVYIDNLASYVDYDTNYDMSKTPFVFQGYYNTLISGEGHYNMANNGKVKIKVESNEPKTYVDANGDGDYELSE